MIGEGWGLLEGEGELLKGGDGAERGCVAAASSVSVVEDRGRRRPEVGFLWGLSGRSRRGRRRRRGVGLCRTIPGGRE